MTWREVLAAVLFVAATIFGFGGVVGLFRFRNPYAKLQASSLTSTTAVLCVFFGVLVLSPSAAFALKMILIIGFFLLSSPTGGHIVARFIWNSDYEIQHPDSVKRRGKKRRQREGST